MYKIYYVDVNSNKIKSFSTIAVGVDDAITRLFLYDTQEKPRYRILKIDHLIL